MKLSILANETLLATKLIQSTTVNPAFQYYSKKLNYIERVQNRMAWFRINELVPILANIVSKIEDDDYIYSLVYTHPRGNKDISHLAGAIVKKDFEDFSYSEDINNKCDSNIFKDKIIHIIVSSIISFQYFNNVDINIFKRKQLNFKEEFKESPFPYLYEFIYQLIDAKYEKDNRELSVDEIDALAQEFIKARKENYVKVLK